MKTAQEPLVEELQGLSLLGILAGLFALPIIGFDPFLGALIGWQFAPLLSIIEGEVGENFRKAGWEADVRRAKVQDRAVELWASADAKWGLRDRWVKFDARGKLVMLNDRYALTERAALVGAWLVARVWVPLKACALRCLARLEDKGIAPKARALWQRTGIPQWCRRQYQAFEDSQVLRARMRQIELKERRGDGGSGGVGSPFGI